MTIDRRTLLKSGLSAGLLATGVTRAYSQSATTLKVGTLVQTNHSMYIRLAEAAEAIKAESNGKINVRIFPNGQLGSDTDMISQVRSGGIDLLTSPGVVVANLVPMASLNSVGFAFHNYQSVWKAMDGTLGNYIRAQIQKSGLVVADKIWDNGFRHITSVKPITDPGQLVGMKIRVPVSPVLLSLFKALGAAPTPINFNELYSALQTKIVEGQENPLTLINNSKLYEVQKHCAMTGHSWDGFWLLGNPRSLDGLGAASRDLVMKHMNAAALKQREDSEKLAVSLEADLTAKGMVFGHIDPTPFREVLKKNKFYEEWRGKFGEEAWSQLEASVGKLG